jgi:hypothetical protein
MSRRQQSPLSRQALKKLAAKQILGPEFLTEAKHIEQQGTQFDLDYGPGIGVSAVTALLLDDGVQNTLGVKPRRAEALAQARSDRDFLNVRLDDFHIRPGGEKGEKVYISGWHKEVLKAIAEQLGHRRYDVVYWSQHDHDSPGGDAWGHMDDSFIEELAECKISWLDLLRHTDPNVSRYAVAYLADPADPEAVAIALIEHRLNQLESALEQTLGHEREQAKLRAAKAIEQGKDQQVTEAWDGFFAPTSAPLTPLSAPPAQPPRRPRGVAEQLGDHEL